MQKGKKTRTLNDQYVARAQKKRKRNLTNTDNYMHCARRIHRKKKNEMNEKKTRSIAIHFFFKDLHTT